MGTIWLSQGRIDAAYDAGLWALKQAPNELQSQKFLLQVKTKRHYFKGLWWRYHHWLQAYSQTELMRFLIVATYGVYQGAQLGTQLTMTIMLLWFTLIGIQKRTLSIFGAHWQQLIEQACRSVKLPDY